MLVLTLAWRSFLRHRRRSAITVAAVAFSLTLMLVFVGIGTDGHERMAELGIRLGAGHVLIQGRGYQEMRTLEHVVQRPERALAAARALPGVSVVVPRVHASGLISTGDSSAPVLVSGVDPQLEPQASTLPAERRIVEGAYIRPREALEFRNQPGDIYIGVELARTLELTVGDRTVLTVSPRDAARPRSAAFLVRGIFKSGVMELDQSYVEIALDEAQRLLELDGSVSQVAVLLDELDDTAAAAAALRERLPRELEVLPWQEALSELHEAIVLDDAGMYLMMAIIFVIVAIGIFNTVLMSVMERTRELGVMLALGTRRTSLFALVLTESLILALVAAAVGIGCGLAIHHVVATHGIDVASYAGDYEFAGIVFEGRMYSSLHPADVLRWSLVVILLTLLASVYPALRATRLQPVEAMRHV